MKTNKKIVITGTFTIATIIALIVFSKFPPITETIYSRGIYRVVASVISPISSLFPISLFDLFTCGVILYFLYLLIFFLIYKRGIKAFLSKMLFLITFIFVAFYWLWGFNYFRETPFERLNLQKQEFQEIYITEALDTLIPLINKNFIPELSISNKEVDKLIEQSYKRHADIFGLRYPMGKRRPKTMLFTGIYSKSGVHGYFGPFFNEIHLNGNLLSIQYPTVLAHEKSHQMGISSEAEANFYGYLICKYSGNKELEYCADLKLTVKFLRNLQKANPESYKIYYSEIDTNVIEQLVDIKKYWLNLLNHNMSDIQQKAYNSYLKSNGVKRGIQDYDMVSELIIAWNHRKY